LVEAVLTSTAGLDDEDLLDGAASVAAAGVGSTRGDP
jgi:hypothetical protein